MNVIHTYMYIHKYEESDDRATPHILLLTCILLLSSIDMYNNDVGKRFMK